MSIKTLEKLRGLNSALDIRAVSDSAFAPYGRIVREDGLSDLVRYLNENTPVNEGVFYQASDNSSEALPVYQDICRKIFGGQDIQIGWCNGTNTLLNALEYHASTELNVAATDSVLLLAKMADCVDGKVDGSAVRGFLIEAGQAVLLDSSTLHFAPCAVSCEGFRMGIILPRGTNAPLEKLGALDAPLWMQNKWLLAHGDADHLVNAGAYVGLTGPRIAVKFE